MHGPRVRADACADELPAWHVRASKLNARAARVRLISCCYCCCCCCCCNHFANNAALHHPPTPVLSCLHSETMQSCSCNMNLTPVFMHASCARRRLINRQQQNSRSNGSSSSEGSSSDGGGGGCSNDV